MDSPVTTIEQLAKELTVYKAGEKKRNDKIAEDLHNHAIADKSFMDAQQIHNLEMKETQKRMADTMARMERKLDVQIASTDGMVEVYSSLSKSSKIILKVSGFLVAVVAALAALKYIITGLLK